MEAISKTSVKTEIVSPDRQHKLQFNNSSEAKPGVVMSKFSLAGISSKAKMQFPGILALGKHSKSVSWSASAQLFSVAVGIPFECFLIVDIKNKQFAVIKMRNVRVMSAQCSDDEIVIGYADEFNPENSTPKKYPTRLFLNPGKLTFKFTEITWHDIARLETFKSIAKEVPQHELLPIENGWNKFEGTLPQTTELMVWELKEFAKYGDPQSEEWLKELMTRTNEPNLWIKTSDYIGVKQRN